MTLQEKLALAMTHVNSIARHDDEPIDARERVTEALRAHIDAELGEARKRETQGMGEKRAAEAALVKAQEAVKRAKQRLQEVG